MTLKQINQRKAIEALFHRLDGVPWISFPQKRQPLEVPEAQGVYVIRNVKGTVVHVGRTVRGRNGLAQRLGNHLSGKSSFAREFLEGRPEKLRSGYTFQFIKVPDDRERALLEHYATGWHCPLHLGLGRYNGPLDGLTPN